MTKQERHSGRLAKKLVEALIALHEYDGDPIDVLSDAKVRLSGETGSEAEEAKEMIYYLECRLSGDDPFGGKA